MKNFCAVGPLFVPATPQLSGRMRWKYCSARNAFYGGLDVVCTGGNQSAISNLCYIYEDREYYLRDTNSAEKLSKTSSVVFNGKTFAVVRLDGVAEALRTTALNTTNTFGVIDDEFSDAKLNNRIVPAAYRQIALATTNIVQLARYHDPTAMNQTLGYLSWQENGYDATNYHPLAVGLPPIPGGTALAAASAPMTVRMINRSIGYGLPPADVGSDPSLVLAAFAPPDADGVIRGRVEMVRGEVRGVPGANAHLVVLGAFDPSGEFLEVAEPRLSAEDGSFEFSAPPEVRYFRARLTIEDIVR